MKWTYQYSKLWWLSTAQILLNGWPVQRWSIKLVDTLGMFKGKVVMFIFLCSLSASIQVGYTTTEPKITSSKAPDLCCWYHLFRTVQLWQKNITKWEGAPAASIFKPFAFWVSCGAWQLISSATKQGQFHQLRSPHPNKAPPAMHPLVCLGQTSKTNIRCFTTRVLTCLQ